MRLFTKRAVLGGQQSGGALVTGVSSGQQIVGDGRSQWTLQRGVDMGMRRSVWVFRGVLAIASNQAKLPFVVRAGHPIDGDIIADHPVSAKLNQAPNDYESAVQFRTRLSAQLLLNRKGVFIEVVWTKGGDVHSLHLLPPDTVEPIKGGRADDGSPLFVSGYRVAIGDGLKKVLAPEQVIWIRNPHPSDPYSSLTPLEAAGIPIEVGHLAQLFQQSYLLRDGRPGGIVGINGEVEDDVAYELEERMNGGASQAGHWTVVEAEKVSLATMGGTPADAQHVETRRISKEDILAGLGTPESVLGNASGRTWDNAKTERLVFWSETMPPHLSTIASPLDALDHDLTTFCGFDVSGVDVLVEARLEREKHLLAEWSAGAISLDDYLEATGREPLGTAASRSHFLPSGQVPFTEQSDGGAIGEVVALRSVAGEKSARFRVSRPLPR